jgi:hypothetical protein
MKKRAVSMSEEETRTLLNMMLRASNDIQAGMVLLHKMKAFEDMKKLTDMQKGIQTAEQKFQDMSFNFLCSMDSILSSKYLSIDGKNITEAEAMQLASQMVKDLKASFGDACMVHPDNLGRYIKKFEEYEMFEECAVMKRWKDLLEPKMKTDEKC